MDSGRVDVRYCPTKGKYRFRFYGVSPDHHETILMALERARKELETQYDTVALEAIMMNYLEGGNVNAPAMGVIMKKHSPEEVLLAFEEAFPQFEVTTKIKKQVQSA